MKRHHRMRDPRMVGWRFARFRSVCGFSLVETMVGLLIGLLGTVMIMQIAVLFQERRNSAVAGSQATGQGALAMHAVERELRRAGYAFGAAAGCSLRRSFDNVELAAIPLTPVAITFDPVGSDTLAASFGARPTAVQPMNLTEPHPAGSTGIFVADSAGIAPKDQLILFESGRDCLLVEATSIEAAVVRHAPGISRWNPAVAPAGSVDFTTAGAVVNVGALETSEFAIANGNLRRRRYVAATNTWQAEILATGILMLKAQYGFDARAGNRDEFRVTRWSENLIDADGSGTVGDVGDWRRIVAVRIALLAQTGVRERPGANGCDTTVLAPQWQAGTATGDVVATDFPIAQIPDWQCFRYQTYETVVPLRNMLWQ